MCIWHLCSVFFENLVPNIACCAANLQSTSDSLELIRFACWRHYWSILFKNWTETTVTDNGEVHRQLSCDWSCYLITVNCCLGTWSLYCIDKFGYSGKCGWKLDRQHNIQTAQSPRLYVRNSIQTVNIIYFMYW